MLFRKPFMQFPFFTTAVQALIPVTEISLSPYWSPATGLHPLE